MEGPPFQLSKRGFAIRDACARRPANAEAFDEESEGEGEAEAEAEAEGDEGVDGEEETIFGVAAERGSVAVTAKGGSGS